MNHTTANSNSQTLRIKPIAQQPRTAADDGPFLAKDATPRAIPGSVRTVPRPIDTSAAQSGTPVQMRRNPKPIDPIAARPNVSDARPSGQASSEALELSD